MTQRKILAGGLVAATSMLAPSTALSSGQATISVNASLRGTSEIPALGHKVVKGDGRFVGTLKQTKTGYRFAWYLTFKGLTGTATFADIERGSASKHGATVAFLCGPCKSGAHGSFYASPGELSLLEHGGLYVNVRTKRHPGGEVRGRLSKSH